MIGSSDTHTSFAAVEENNFSGKFSTEEPGPGRYRRGLNPARPAALYAAAGYVAAWARENTRESLFDAFERREVYATTGPRIQVRFFGGWGFAPQDHLRADMAAVQVVKSWLDRDGESRERVYDVALSDGRRPSLDGELAPPLASTVDVDSATYLNRVGAAQLGVVWEDPAFDPDLEALYYVRVLEIFTPRWTTVEAALYDDELAQGVPAEIQERAYTSPIWYSPP